MIEIDLNKHYKILINQIEYNIGIIDKYMLVDGEGRQIRNFNFGLILSNGNQFETKSTSNIYYEGEWFFDGWYYDEKFKYKISEDDIESSYEPNKLENEINSNFRVTYPILDKGKYKEKIAKINREIVKKTGDKYDYYLGNSNIIKVGKNIKLYARWNFIPKFNVLYSIYSINGVLPKKVQDIKFNEGCSVPKFVNIDYLNREERKDTNLGIEKLFLDSENLYGIGDSIDKVLYESDFVSKFEELFINSTYKFNDHTGEVIFLEQRKRLFIDREKIDYVFANKYGKRVRKYGTWEVASNWKFYKDIGNINGRINEDCKKVFRVEYIDYNGTVKERLYEFLVLNRFLMFNEYISVKYAIKGDLEFGYPNYVDKEIFPNKASSLEEKNIKILDDRKNYIIKKPLDTDDDYAMEEDITVLGNWEFDGWKSKGEYVSGRIKISKDCLTLVPVDSEGIIYEEKYLLEGEWKFSPKYQVTYFISKDIEYDMPDFGVDFTPKKTDTGFSIGEEIKIKDIEIFRRILKGKSVVLKDLGRMCVGSWNIDGWYYGDPNDDDIYWEMIQRCISGDSNRLKKPQIMDKERLRIAEIDGKKYYRFPVHAQMKFVPRKQYGINIRENSKHEETDTEEYNRQYEETDTEEYNSGNISDNSVENSNEEVYESVESEKNRTKDFLIVRGKKFIRFRL